MESLLLFLLAFAAFVFPGYWWVTWLHGRDGNAWWLRLALGYIWSFGLFSLIGGPFLWFGGSFATFSWTLAAVWAVFVPLSCWLWRRVRGTMLRTVPGYRVQEKADGGTPQAPRGGQFSAEAGAKAIPCLAWAALTGYAAIIVAGWFLWSRRSPFIQIRLLAMSPVVLLMGCGLLWPLRSKLAPYLTFGPDDDEAPPPIWTVVAVGLIVLQAIGSTVYFRPDWDDCYYLGAVLDYEHSPSLNDRDPTTREMIGVNAPHRAMCLELWGAVLCRLTGADPQTLFHSLLPAPFVLLSYAAYAALLGQILPRKWVPLALVGLSGYFLWGIGEQAGAANHFLIRIWQGKAVMLHLAIPFVAALVIQLSQQLNVRLWLSLTAAIYCALGFSSSAIFVAAALIACLALVLVPAVERGRIKFLLVAAAACWPLAIQGAGIMTDSRIEVTTTSAAAPDADGMHEPSPALIWAATLLDNWARHGDAEILWLLSLPFSALLLFEMRRWAYPVLLPLLLLATFANPFLILWVAAHVTSQEGYYRLFWLFPVGPGLGILFALTGRLCASVIDNAPSWWRATVPLVVSAAGVGLLVLLPCKYVFGPMNRFGAFMYPQVGHNLQKMPPDVLRIARLLDKDPSAANATILCGEEVTACLIPWSSRYHYVVIRPFYLPGYGLDPTQQDGAARYFLTLIAESGKHAEKLHRARILLGIVKLIPSEILDGSIKVPPPAGEGMLPRLADVPELLDRYRVEYVITSLPMWLTGSAKQALGRQIIADRDDFLRETGFEEVFVGREQSLWKRVSD